MSDKQAGLVINGTFRIAAEDRQTFIDIVRAHIPETLAKPGCIDDTLAIDVTDENLFHILEGWTDRASLQAHIESASFQATLVEVAANVRTLARDVRLYTVSAQESLGPPDQA